MIAYEAIVHSAGRNKTDIVGKESDILQAVGHKTDIGGMKSDVAVVGATLAVALMCEDGCKSG